MAVLLKLKARAHLTVIWFEMYQYPPLTAYLTYLMKLPGGVGGSVASRGRCPAPLPVKADKAVLAEHKAAETYSLLWIACRDTHET